MRADLKAELNAEYRRLLAETEQAILDLVGWAANRAASDFSDIDELDRQEREGERLSRRITELKKRLNRLKRRARLSRICEQ